MGKVHKRTIPKKKKNVNDPDNHNGVVSNSEPDILECEVKWVLRSTAAHKDSGGDRIPAKLVKILKDFGFRTPLLLLLSCFSHVRPCATP